jgi:hypothetical protein
VAALVLGTRSPDFGGSFWRGRLDEVELFDRVLQPAEVKAIFDAGQAGKCKCAAGCVPAPVDLVAWWPFDQDVVDIRGSHASKLVGPGNEFVPARVVNGFKSGGQLDLVEIANSPDLIPSHFTIDAWLRVDGIGVFNSAILWKGNSRGANASSPVAIGVFGTSASRNLQGKLFVLVNGGATVVTLDSALPLQQWLHLAVTADGTEVRIYMNGNLEKTGAETGVWFDSAVPLQIGAIENASVDNHFNGVIDELEIFSRVLCAEEIKAIYTAGPCGKCKCGSISKSPAAIGGGA